MTEQESKDVLLLIEKCSIRHAVSCPHGHRVWHEADGAKHESRGNATGLLDEDCFDVCNCEALVVYEAACRLRESLIPATSPLPESRL